MHRVLQIARAIRDKQRVDAKWEALAEWCRHNQVRISMEGLDPVLRKAARPSVPINTDALSALLQKRLISIEALFSELEDARFWLSEPDVIISFEIAHTIEQQFDVEQTAFNARSEADYAVFRELTFDGLRDEIARLRTNYEAADQASIELVCSALLERSPYPHEFPQRFRLVYQPQSSCLTINYEMPSLGMITADYSGPRNSDQAIS